MCRHDGTDDGTITMFKWTVMRCPAGLSSDDGTPGNNMPSLTTSTSY